MNSLVIRDLLSTATEGEIRHALAPYGTVIDVNLFPQLRQAVVAMATPEDAAAVVRNPISIMGVPVVVEMRGAAGGGQMANNGGYVHHQQHQQHHQQHMGGGGGMLPTPTPAQPMGQGANDSILVNVTEVRHPVTDDVLRRVFNPLAPVRRTMIISSQAGSVTAAVQFNDSFSAQKALERNGRNIYEDCNRMDIQLCNWDAVSGGRGRGGRGAHAQADMAGGFQPYQQSGGRGRGRGGGGGMGMQQQAMMNPMGMMGMQPQMGMQGMMPMQQQPMMMNPMSMQPQLGMGMQPGMQIGGGMGRGGMDMGQGQQGGAGGSTTYMNISNVDLSCPLKDLFTLLEVFGNVNFLRRQFKNKTDVICKMFKEEELRNAMSCLEGCPFYGHNLKFRAFPNFSDRHAVTADGDPSDPSVEAYDFSRTRHRKRDIQPPGQQPKRYKYCEFLFVTNLPEEFSDQQIMDFFVENGFQPVNLFRKDNKKSMTIVFPDCAQSVQALVRCHNMQILPSKYLRIMFGHDPTKSKVENQQDHGQGQPQQQQQQQQEVTMTD